MSDILCVTSRSLCREDFPHPAGAGCRRRPRRAILREKDLPPEDYRALAERALALCRARGCPASSTASRRPRRRWGAGHSPAAAPAARPPAGAAGGLPVLGTSCHSVEDAREAEKLGCTYITAGHVFATDCKKGLTPGGWTSLRAVCRAVDLPVWAIGGITPENFPSVRAAGARGDVS